MSSTRQNANIGIAALPLRKIENIPLSYFIEVIYPLSKDIYVITGKRNVVSKDNLKKIHIYEIEHKIGINIIIKIIKHILIELKISYKILKLSKNIDLWIFYTGGLMPLPMIAVKLLNKKRLLVLASSAIAGSKAQSDILSIPMTFLSKISYLLSNRIIIYSPNLIKEWDLEKHGNKISVAYEHFVDFNEFKIKKQLDERDNLVGYIGRLSEEKGVLNFVKAIPKVLEKENKIKFLVGGDGQLRDKIEEYLDVASLNDKVKLTGWIPDEEFSTYLNELKLFVLPSYTEGLPYTLLEAMACGTPVLATPVGAIPDVIKDGETGFIMENNSPECIAENIVRALAHPNINEITKNARALVEEKYNYQAAVDGYRIILSSTF